MTKKSSENLYVVDHANKRADRECSNPNRKKRRFVQTWDQTSGATTTVEIPDWGDTRKDEESE